MAVFVAARLLQAVPVLFLSSVAVFLLIRLVPGDAAVAMAGKDATPEQVEALRHRFGLDQPLVNQYVTWIVRLVQADLGTAYLTQRPIADLIRQRVPATLELAVGALVVMITVGCPLGIFAAVRPRHPLSRLLSLVNAVALGTPTFWLGILLVLVVGVSLRWLPPSGYVAFAESPLESIRLLLLPALTLGAAPTAVLIRFLKSSISEVVSSDFVRTAYAKGLRERVVVLRHVLKIALLPVITVMAISFGHLLGGAIVTESIFGWPGLGRLMLDAIENGDYLIVQSTMLLFVITFIVVNVVADVSYGFLDPRIRSER